MVKFDVIIEVDRMGLNKTKKLEPDKKAIEWAVLFGINIILIIGIIN